ncbi:hypothetical protein RHECNPAF_970026 [Rhizobium etli CNPAF512]|nr:hypothetical protein RHECNPAF_970026 [Rhizobium etli CNPAF512]
MTSAFVRRTLIVPLPQSLTLAAHDPARNANNRPVTLDLSALPMPETSPSRSSP